MGFFVTESISFPSFGISCENCYVTIKATYSHIKKGSNSLGFFIPHDLTGDHTDKPYVLSCRYYIYSAKDSALQALKEEQMVVHCLELPSDPITTLYTAIKDTHFSGLTITDDL